MPVHRDLLCLQITWRTIVPMVKIIIKASPPGAVQLEVGLDLQSTDDLIRKYSLTSWRHPGAHRGWWKIQLETHILRQNCKHGLMSPKDTVDLFIKKKRKKKIPEGWWFPTPYIWCGTLYLFFEKYICTANFSTTHCLNGKNRQSVAVGQPKNVDKKNRNKQKSL